ncbi:MAG: hypothetical protein QM784_38360 [Polyangiaceae bacterium]
MGSRIYQSPRRPSSHLGFVAALGVVSACNLTKKEEPAPATTTPPVVPAAPVFNVTPTTTPTPAPAAANPDPNPSRAAEAVKGKTSVTGTGGTTAKGTSATSTGGTTSTKTTAAQGGSTSKAATTALPLPTVDMACINACATKAQACIAAAGLDGTKLAACQSVVTTCQSDCKAK